MGSMTVGKVLEIKGNAEIFCVSGTTSLADLVREACRRNIGAVMITDDHGRLCGIISERDVMRQCDRHVDFVGIKVAEVMSRDLITAHKDDHISAMMDLMISHKIRHMPVVDGEKVIGIITVRDLLFAIRHADKEEMRKFIEYLEQAASERQAESDRQQRKA